MKTIYLAGPDVFLPRERAIERGEYLKTLCAQNGFRGLFPMDNAVPHKFTGAKAAAWIANANMQMIREADIVMANLNDWRGEPDSGTAWEIGFATALNKPVFAYRDGDNFFGAEWEEFGGPVNLMIWCSVELIRGHAGDCIDIIKDSCFT